MIYYHLRYLNWIFTIFGLKKPFITDSAKPSKIYIWDKLWTLFVMTALLFYYIWFEVINTEFVNIKNNLPLIRDTNEVLVSCAVLLIHLIHGETLCLKLYQTNLRLIQAFHVKNREVKKFCWKIILWTFTPKAFLLSSIILEIVLINPPYVLAITIPVYLENIHLFIHLVIILGNLKALNDKTWKKLKVSYKNNPFEIKSKRTKKMMVYLLDTELKFEVDDRGIQNMEISFFCSVYEELCECMTLLKKRHGLQVSLELWMIFITNVIEVTQAASGRSPHLWLSAVRCGLPFLRYLLLAFVDDQIRVEVERVDMLILKQLIDFRCDLASRNLLSTYKSLVNTNALRFRGMGLFHVNYSTVLGTVVSVVTYSIILIQFIVDSH